MIYVNYPTLWASRNKEICRTLSDQICCLSELNSLSTSSKTIIMAEVSAVTVLKRATELDGQNRLGEALVCYQEGIQLLILCLKGMFLLLCVLMDAIFDTCSSSYLSSTTLKTGRSGAWHGGLFKSEFS